MEPLLVNPIMNRWSTINQPLLLLNSPVTNHKSPPSSTFGSWLSMWFPLRPGGLPGGHSGGWQGLHGAGCYEPWVINHWLWSMFYWLVLIASISYSPWVDFPFVELIQWLVRIDRGWGMMLWESMPGSINQPRTQGYNKAFSRPLTEACSLSGRLGKMDLHVWWIFRCKDVS